jgi:hypothetical protein
MVATQVPYTPTSTTSPRHATSATGGAWPRSGAYGRRTSRCTGAHKVWRQL